MSYSYCENELDEALFIEASKETLNVEKINQLLQDGANINAIDNMGGTVLGYIIWEMNNNNADIELVKHLIAKGADVNIKDEGINVCLFKAVFQYRKDVFEVLLEAGADPNGTAWDSGQTILDMVIGDSCYCEVEHQFEEAKIQDEIADLLISYGAKRSLELGGTEE